MNAARGDCSRPCCWSSESSPRSTWPRVRSPAGHWARASATTLLFVNNWVAGFGGSSQLGSLAPTWSLAQEEQFYLIWPLDPGGAALSPAPAGGRGRNPAGTIAGLLALVPLVEQQIPSYDMYFSPLDRGAELLLGCAGAVAWRNRLLIIPRIGP